MINSTEEIVDSISENRVSIRRHASFVEFPAEAVEQSIPSRFEDIAARFPTHLAVQQNSQEISYDTLNRSANRISRALVALNTERDERVAIVADNNVMALAGIIGILKAGKTYVPLDSSYSNAWAKFILNDTDARVVLVTHENESIVKEWISPGQKMIGLEGLAVNGVDENLALDITPKSLAHVLYTSGSTGQPKGVADNHRNILHHVMRVTNRTFVSSHDRMTLLRPPNSSGALMNAFSALLNGASLFPMEVKEIGLGGIANWLNRERITFFHSGGAVFRHFAQMLTGREQFPDLRLIRLSSGRISKVDVDLFKTHFHRCVLLHVLSSTEANTYRMYFLDKDSELKDGTVPVGYPVEDMEVVILDDTGNQLPEGSPGEIAIRSAYLFPHYWRNPELTARFFLNDSKDTTKRIFRTSDLGILLPDGCLNYLGRKDFRLKIRGHSIQSEEVEIALLKIPEVKQAVVVAYQDAYGDDRMVAYIAFNQNPGVTVSRLRELLKQKLPDYMLPSTFVVQDSLPVMPNGKVDRQKLSQPTTQRPQLNTPFVAPQSALETVITRRWSSVLGIDEIGVHDKFFDLGGDSLLASKIVSSLSAIFPWNLSLAEFFEALTIAGTSRALIAKEFASGQAEKLASSVLQVENMSTEELEAQLNSERNKRNHGQPEITPAKDR